MKNISFTQIFKFYNVPATEETAFCCIYDTPYSRFAVFKNSEDDGKISCYCMHTGGLVTKNNLALMLSPDFTFDAAAIAAVRSEQLQAHETMSFEQAALFCARLARLPEGAKINGMDLSLLNGYIDIYSRYGTADFQINLFADGRASDSIVFSGSAATFAGNRPGYILTKNSGYSAVLLAADPFFFFKILSDRYYNNYRSLLASPGLPYFYYASIFSQFSREDMELPLKLAACSAASYRIALECAMAYIQFSKKISTAVTFGSDVTVSFAGEINPIFVSQMVNDINVSVFKKLGISNTDHEAKAHAQPHLFFFTKSNGMNFLKFPHTSFHLQVFTEAFAKCAGFTNISFFTPLNLPPDPVPAAKINQDDNNNRSEEQTEETGDNSVPEHISTEVPKPF